MYAINLFVYKKTPKIIIKNQGFLDIKFNEITIPWEGFFDIKQSTQLFVKKLFFVNQNQRRSSWDKTVLVENRVIGGLIQLPDNQMILLNPPAQNPLNI